MDDYLGSGDPGVDEFVDVHISSFASWDVVVYFEHNAEASLDLGELSKRLGRKEFEIEFVLCGLAEGGLVRGATGPDGIARYSLSPDPAVHKVVTRFVELAKVRELRLDFVRRVLAGMSRS